MQKEFAKMTTQNELPEITAYIATKKEFAMKSHTIKRMVHCFRDNEEMGIFVDFDRNQRPRASDLITAYVQ